jgi:hypothetical protein
VWKEATFVPAQVLGPSLCKSLRHKELLRHVEHKDLDEVNLAPVFCLLKKALLILKKALLIFVALMLMWMEKVSSLSGPLGPRRWR